MASEFLKNRYISLEEARNVLGISEATFRKLVRSGLFPKNAIVRISPRITKVNLDLLEEWIASGANNNVLGDGSEYPSETVGRGPR